MLIGYMRVSTGEQSLDLQRDALGRAGCERVYDECSGRATERPGCCAIREQPGSTRHEQACVGFLFRCYSDPKHGGVFYAATFRGRPRAARALNIPSANFRNAPSGLRSTAQPSDRHLPCQRSMTS
jgi:Resolvase, N terminal domain